uniref:Uncharacterized protein n=1 Tax=viral metagenome TaxID=1070528 RepID=A0A6M3KTX4_9ZZZZ
MREIKTLIQQLRNYPNNLFVYTQEESEDNKSGLVVCNLAGEEQGFIELGTDNRQVVVN